MKHKKVKSEDVVDDCDSSDEDEEKVLNKRLLESLMFKEELDQRLLSACAGETGHVDEDSIRDLLSQGADINSQDEEPGWTALMHSVKAGRLRLVRMLLEQKADVNITDPSGFTALSVAAYHGHQNIVSLLLSHGAGLEHGDTIALRHLLPGHGDGRSVGHGARDSGQLDGVGSDVVSHGRG